MRLLRNAERGGSAAELELLHDGEIYRVQLRRVDTARRFILRVRGATRDAILTMPRRATLKDAADFAQRNAAWVGVRLRRLPQQVPFAHGSVFPLRGKPIRIVHTPGVRGTVWIGGDQQDEAPFRLYVSGEPPHTERRVRDWLKIQARKDIEISVARYAEMISRPTPAITLRDTTTRWGSCSAVGALNFSWRLVMAPSDVLTYLAAHEVCHLAHMNHSARFWKLCRSICPQMDEAEAWLRSHGADLHRYGSKPGRVGGGSAITF